MADEPWITIVNENSNLDTLEASLTGGDRVGRPTRQAIEAVRVAALGKKGSVSELLKTLGTMTPGGAADRGARRSTA